MIQAYKHGVWLVDLAPLGDPAVVPSALAAALGLEIHAEKPLPALVGALKDKRMLLVLDNCEHLVGAAAEVTVVQIARSALSPVLAARRPFHQQYRSATKFLPVRPA